MLFIYEIETEICWWLSVYMCVLREKVTVRHINRMLLSLYDILCFDLSEYHEAIREYHKHQGISRNDGEGTNA